MVAFICRKFLKYNKLKYWCYQCYLKDRNVVHVRFKNTSFPTEHKEIVTLSNGNKITLSTGLYARIADSSATALYGDTAVMVAVVTEEVVEKSYLLLHVNYKQKAAAAGRIPASFLRKESFHTDAEIVGSRLVDRSLRPLFPERCNKQIQLTCNMLAIDGINDPEVLAINAASTALSLSSIPWKGPVGAVRVGVINDEVLINPTRREMQKSTLNLVVAARQQQVVMLEGSADNISLSIFRKALKKGIKECHTIINGILTLQKKCGKVKENVTDNMDELSDIIQPIKELSAKKLHNILTNYSHNKTSRDNAIKEVRTAVINDLQNECPNLDIEKAGIAFTKVCKDVLRELIFENKRCDGRKIDELRNVTCKTNLYPTLHGSSLFQRGQTQVLCTVTLDSPENALRMDTASMLISGVKEKNFFLHYEFPSYATNEIRTTTHSRREIGHGMLAEKGLRPVMPDNHAFTTRLNCEVLESNGSSSMASVCAGSLALLDAGVPISEPVSGIAMGLVTKCNDQNLIEDYKILTDIMGMEDYFGDMDFKIAATAKGFTAFQLDVKIMGLPTKIISETMEKFISANNKLLSLMRQTITGPRTEGKENTMPVIENITVPVHQKGKFIGVGGMNLKKIFFQTGVNISFQDNDTFSVFAPNQAAMDEAKEMIKGIMEQEREVSLEFGEIYTATIVEIRESGVLVTLYPNMTPTLLHNNQLDQRRISHPSVLGLEVGQEIKVKYFGRDPASGYMRLSRKVLQDMDAAIKSYKTSTD